MKDVFDRMNRGEIQTDRIVGYQCDYCQHFQGFPGVCENCGCSVNPVGSNDNIFNYKENKEAKHGNK